MSEHGDTTGTPPSGGGRILKYNLTSGSTTAVVVAQRYDATTNPGGFMSPDAIVVDPATHNLYVADRYLDRVQLIDSSTGAVIKSWGTGTVGGTNEMHGPVGLARDSAGAIYVSEHGEMNGGAAGTMVAKYTFDGSGNPVQQWRKGNSLLVPYSVAVNGSSLLISDGFNHQVQVWDLNGNPQSSYPVTAIALGGSVDGSGNLWIATAVNDTGSPQQIEKRNAATGALLLTYGTEGGGNGQFQLPFDVVYDAATSRAYVADYHNNRVAVVDFSAPPSGGIPVITSSASASGTVGQAFSYQITATNSPTSFAATALAGTGLSLNASTGLISGTPTAAGTISSQLTATNASGTSVAATLTISVAASTPPSSAAPTVTSFGLDFASVTVSHAHMVVVFSAPVTGVDATDFAINAQGSTSGTITGVTGSGTTYNVDFDYVDAAGSLQMAIKTSGTGITDGTNAFAGGGVTATDVYGVHSTPPPDTAQPTVASFTAGTPSGSSVNFTLTFNEAVTGVSSGDFLVATGGTATATVGTVTGSGTTYTVSVNFTGSGSVQLTVVGGATANIRDAATNWFAGGGSSISNAVTVGTTSGTPPTITSGTSATATAGTAFSYQITASGSPTSFAATGLTGTGLSVNTSTGVISGTPSAAGTITSQLTATNSSGTSGAVTLTITVNAATTGTAPTITSATTAAATAGTAFSYQITATGSPTSFAATGLSGTGLSVNTTTGVISGTPLAAGNVTSQLTASNGFGTSAPVTLTIAVAAAGTAPTITSAPTANATVGSSFGYQIVATGSPTSFAATGLAGTGLSLNTSTGAITGTPTAAGTITSQLTAANTFGTSAPKTLTITVGAAAGGGSVPTVTSPATASATVGSSFAYVITASNSPTFFSATGLNGTGLSVNATTGMISGTPNGTGTIISLLSASNGAGTSAPKTLTITVASAGNPPPSSQKTQTIVFIPPVSNLFVGDTLQLSATTNSGLPITYKLITGDATLSGSTLIINSTSAVVVRASQAGDSTWASASMDTTFNAVKHAQSIATTSIPSAAHTDSALTLNATASSGLPITYTVVSGPATVSGNTLFFTGSGTVTLRASQAGNGAFNSSDTTLTLTANPVPRLINISSRLNVSSNDANGASIAGFVVTGNAAKQMLIRAVGPSLTRFGISAPLANPTLTLHDNTGAVIASNSGWANDASIAAAAANLGAFDLTQGSKDAALLVSLQPGPYTATVQSSTNTGPVLIEVYDVSAMAAVPTKQLINISTRGTVGTGDNVLIGGFVVSGNEPKKVLIRGVGPSLAGFGVGGTLSDPTLKIYSGNTVIAQNDNWGTALKAATETPATAAEIAAAATATGAFPLTSGSADAAVIVTLQPGPYSAIVTGANNSTGAAMIEVYEVPNP